MPDQVTSAAGEIQHSRRIRITLFTCCGLAVLIAIAALTWTAGVNRHNAAALDKEVRAHCLTDTAHDNSQRALDLALIRADRQQFAMLTAELPHAADHSDRVIIASQLLWLREVIRARQETIPAYRDPRRC